MTLFGKSRSRGGARSGRPSSKATPLDLAGSETERLAMVELLEHPELLELLSNLGRTNARTAAEGEIPAMSKEKILLDMYQKLVSGGEIPPEAERSIIEFVARTDSASLPHLCLLFANQKRQLQGQLAKASEERARAEATLARLRQPPWHPADVLFKYPDGRLDVCVGGRRQIVVTVPELAEAQLQSGDEVFLDRELSAAVSRNDSPRHTGVVGTVAQTAGGRIILHSVGDEEIVALCAPDLAATLQVGDRVLYKRDTHCIVACLAERTENQYVLEQPPAVRFEDIGGLDAVIAEIRCDLDLHLRHPEIVAKFRLRLMRGLTLVGHPGTGKTMLAGAIARYLSETYRDTTFMHIRPGALRGIFYGESEARIRELFAVARRAPGLVVMFFDELDSYGARGVGVGQDIDGRVLGALLTEVDGLESADHVFCIGATNRLDLCDDALVRGKRFMDRLYQIPRPGREATRQILARSLTPHLPYAGEPDGRAAAARLIDAAVAHLFAPQGGSGVLATVTLANGTRREVNAPAVLNGALITSAVERAQHAAADRYRDVKGGLIVEDLLAALDQALAAEVDKLKSPQAARRILDIPGAEDIVRVEVPAHRRPRRYRYLRAA